MWMPNLYSTQLSTLPRILLHGWRMSFTAAPSKILRQTRESDAVKDGITQFAIQRKRNNHTGIKPKGAVKQQQRDSGKSFRAFAMYVVSPALWRTWPFDLAWKRKSENYSKKLKLPTNCVSVTNIVFAIAICKSVLGFWPQRVSVEWYHVKADNQWTALELAVCYHRVEALKWTPK